ncbi:LysR family transcriptional regulator [Alcanivorax balearicus MACL04]|uniref:LysR family transcriptional regulator n=1 Tax=Alloalcanivorax balearicus MACL04 TaxID=1177182 RepID=A0ABT2QZF1_9GAMM|nr:LysR family transcriptional regulator [Alloalcanivorax balearicus]MCU5782903.1 LysR family transcriptional regulator [Alloalcanivorax balearicus MACL04]
MDRLELLRIFVRVVDCGNFTRAAETLPLPRSSVSGAIKTLEQRVGARLLHRTTRQVTVTEEGHRFYDRCVRLLSDYEETEELFRPGKAPAGRIRVNVPARIGRLVLAPALPAFLDRYPDIKVDLCVADRQVDLVQEAVDCVIRVGPLADSSLIARPLGQLKLINCASPAYLRRHGTPRTVEELPSHRAVHYIAPSQGRPEPWEYRRDGEYHQVEIPGAVAVNNTELYIACCRAGLGMIQVPAYDVREDLDNGLLREVLPEWRAEPMEITLLYPQRLHLSHRFQVFSQWLETVIGERLRPAPRR